MNVGKVLVFAGIALIIIGMVVMIFGKDGSFPKLPGDILIKTDKFTFYFPVVTSIILSIVLTLLFVLFRKFK